MSRVAALLAVLAAALSGAALRQPVALADGNVVAHTAAERVPNDTGLSRVAGGWAQLQWNFAGSHGVNAPAAWANLERAGAPGGAGVTIAVLDTGVAYSDRGRFRHSPDLDPVTFVPGYDFVDDDPYPFDLNGHGTHVTSTIAEETNNGYGLTGLAYGARIMPVRVLDRLGRGDANTVARGVRFATEHGAKIINLSLNFGSTVTGERIPELIDAIEAAYARGVLVVAATGNEGRASVAYPARAEHVLAVGATTESGCLSTFSNRGPGLDVVAPGGGKDAPLRDDPSCSPGRWRRPVYQITTARQRVDRFVISGRFVGTSMATPHVSATAALIIASGVLGTNPAPAAIERRVEQTARDLGAPGYDARYGWGLVDAGAATTPAATSARVPAGSIRRKDVPGVSYAVEPSRRRLHGARASRPFRDSSEGPGRDMRIPLHQRRGAQMAPNAPHVRVLPQIRPEFGLVACSRCLRVQNGAGWFEPEVIIRELRSFDRSQAPMLRPGLCDRCKAQIDAARRLHTRIAA